MGSNCVRHQNQNKRINNKPSDSLMHFDQQQGTSNTTTQQPINNININNIKNYCNPNLDSSKTQFRHLSIREEITFSLENIHKVYDFDPQIIGRGEFGQVRTASLISCPKKKFAIKTISKDKINNLKLIKNEVEILKGCDHPNIVKFYETYQDKKYLHLVMQYCRGGQLQIKNQQSRTSVHKIKLDKDGGKKSLYGYTESQVQQIMQKIFSCVKYIHHYGIVHRDLKLDNFVFIEKTETNCEIKLIDFGLSQKCNTDIKMNALAGTYMYIAPEILAQNGYTKACDLWSCGVIMYNLLCGQFPFHAETTELLQSQIKLGEFKFKGEVWNKVSKEAKDLIKKLLVVNYQKRITASEALLHPFFKQIQVEKMKKQQQSNMLVKLLEFGIMPKLKFQAYKLCLGLMDDVQLKEIRQEFRNFDLDDDGLISLQDLKNCQKINKQNQFQKLTDDELQSVIHKFTKNGEEKESITYTSYIISSLDREKKITNRELDIIFNLLDVDKSGTVTAENLIKALAREGRKLKPNDINAIIEQVDFNKDHCIGKNEFLNMMKYDCRDDMVSQTLKKQKTIIHVRTTEQNLKINTRIQQRNEDGFDSTIDLAEEPQCNQQIKEYEIFYNKNQKNDGIPSQHTQNSQPKIQKRKESNLQEFDNDDFDQKMLEDEYMQAYDTQHTSTNQLEILKLMKNHSNHQLQSYQHASSQNLENIQNIQQQQQQQPGISTPLQNRKLSHRGSYAQKYRNNSINNLSTNNNNPMLNSPQNKPTTQAFMKKQSSDPQSYTFNQTHVIQSEQTPGKKSTYHNSQPFKVCGEDNSKYIQEQCEEEDQKKSNIMIDPNINTAKIDKIIETKNNTNKVAVCITPSKSSSSSSQSSQTSIQSSINQQQQKI